MQSPDFAATLSALFRHRDIPAVLSHIRAHPDPELYQTALPCGHTPLQLASLLGATPVVRALLSLGLRVDAASLSHAATHRHIDILRLLLLPSPACTPTDCHCAHRVPQAGQALHAAAWSASNDAARLILDALCPSGKRNALAFRANDGAMPLHVAALSGDDTLVAAFIDAAADVWATDATQKTPKDWARRYVVAAGKGEEVVRVLEEAEARTDEKIFRERSQCAPARTNATAQSPSCYAA